MNNLGYVHIGRHVRLEHFVYGQISTTRTPVAELDLYTGTALELNVIMWFAGTQVYRRLLRRKHG